MSHDPTRKHFFAQLLGLTAAVGLLSKIGAKVTPGSQVTAEAPVQIRPETRAVPRDVNAV